MPLVLAHVGHWYHALLYLAPVLVLVLFFTIEGRRERRAEEREAAAARARGENPREPPQDPGPDDL
jgi:cytochrome c-type biogenesis protein CcmH/NrfF